MRASFVAGTAMFARAQGVPMERIAEATGLRQEDLLDPEGWLPETIVPAIWRLLAKACPGRAISLEMAKVAPLSMFGPLAYSCRHAPNLRKLLENFVRYRIVMSDRLHMELEEAPDEVWMRVHHPMDAFDGGLAAEMGLALSTRFGRTYMNADERGLRRVELAHAPHGPKTAYEEFFRVPVVFEQPSNALVFEPRSLEQTPKQADPNLFRFIQDHLDQVRARLTTDTKADPLSEIRDAITHNAERSEYGAEALARRVGMSLRKLQRIVADHDTSVRALLEEVREANAHQLLGDRRLSIEEVSFLLNYSDDRAFRRAFKRWTGTTPAQVRRAQRTRAGLTTHA